MNSIKHITDKYHLKINKYTKKDNNIFIDTDKGKYFIKNNKKDKENLFNYLNTKKFNNYIYPYYVDENYEMYKYIEDTKMDKNDKAQDIIFLSSILHNKTSFYKSINKDEIKKTYEEIHKNLKEKELYYEKLKSKIELKEYPSPSEYLLLRNISLVFISIDSSIYFIDEWYKEIKDESVIRVSKIHGNLSLEHIIEKENPYLISWDNEMINYPTIDFLNFFKNNFLELDFNNLYDIYNLKYPLLLPEKLLLYAKILIPEKISFRESEIINTKEVYQFIEYLRKANDLVSKHYPEKSN